VNKIGLKIVDFIKFSVIITRKQYTFMDLLSEVDSKLFAKCKSEGHCLHHNVAAKSSK